MYINKIDNKDLSDYINKLYKKDSINLNDKQLKLIINGLDGIKARARTIIELKEMTSFYKKLLFP